MAPAAPGRCAPVDFMAGDDPMRAAGAFGGRSRRAVSRLESLAPATGDRDQTGMTWLHLASSEWRRRPLRSGVCAMGVAIAVGAMFSMLSFQEGYREGMRSEI